MISSAYDGGRKSVRYFDERRDNKRGRKGVSDEFHYFEPLASPLIDFEKTARERENVRDLMRDFIS